MRQYRIGMTDIERLHHRPGRGVRPGEHLNRTVTLADVWGVSLGSNQPTSPGYRKPTPAVAPKPVAPKPKPYAGYDRTERTWRV